MRTRQKLLLMIISLFCVVGLSDKALAQAGSWRLLNGEWAPLCTATAIPPGGCLYYDATTDEPNGSVEVFEQTGWYIFPTAVANPPRQALKFRVSFEAIGLPTLSSDPSCDMKASTLIRHTGSGASFDQVDTNIITINTLFAPDNGIKKWSRISFEVDAGGVGLDKIQLSVSSFECSTIAIDNVYILALDMEPTPTPTRTATNTATAAATVCTTSTSPAPVPTTCDNGTISIATGSWDIDNQGGTPAVIVPVNFEWTNGYFSTTSSNLAVCSPQVLIVDSEGTPLTLAYGDTVNYVALFCVNGGNRSDTVTEVFYHGSFCTTPAPTVTPINSCSTATNTPTRTPTISPTLPITIQQTLTAAPPTVFGTNTPTGQAHTTATAAAGTAIAHATATAAAASNGATATQNAINATGTAYALPGKPTAQPAPKVCKNYDWFCYGGGNIANAGTCIYTTRVGYDDPNCKGAFGFSNSACPVGYIPPDDKCGVNPTPAPTGTVPPKGACLGPDNGAFNSPDYWSFRNEAIFDPASQSAYLPNNKSGDNSISPKIASDGSDFVIPAPAEGKYMIFSYDARAEGCGDAGVQAIVTYNNNNDSILSNPHVIPNWTNFQFDVSSRAGMTVTFLSFGNFNVNQGIIIDNICFKESDLPPSDPALQEIPPCINIAPNIGGCEVVNQVLFSYGYDVRVWEATYNSGVALLSPSTWVPWLGSALWVNAAKPLACFMLEIYTSVIAYLQSWINELINYAWYFWKSSKAFSDWLSGVYEKYGTWSKANAEGVGGDWLNWWSNQYRPWLDFTANTNKAWAIWLQTNINGPLYQWLKWPSTVTSPWLLWLATSLIDLLMIPYALLSDFFVTSISWIDESLKWLSASLLAQGQGIQAESWNFGIESLNTLINSYNQSSLTGNNLGQSWLQSAVHTWNTYLYPAAQGFIQTQNAFSAIPLLLAAQFVEFVRTAFLMLVTFLSWLWHLLTTYALIPLTFLQGFQEGMNTTPYGNILECTNDNFWCAFFAGFQVINRSVAAAYAYPVVLIAIIIGTIVIVWNAIVAIVSIDVK